MPPKKMQIINSKKGIEKAITHLRDGGVLVYPTESSYGIGCRADDVIAVGNVFAFKERPVDKTVLILVPSVEVAKRLVKWSDKIQQLVDAHWPGQLSIVAQATAEGKLLAPGVVAKDGTIALRMSPHPVAQALCEAVGPLVSSSANKGSEPPCYTLEEIKKWLHKEDDIMILDGGDLQRKKPSTVVRVNGGELTILRDGAVEIS